MVCWLLLPGCSYLYQEEERLRLSWFGAEKGFLPIAYTNTTRPPHSVVQIQTKGRGRRRRRHVRRATPRHRRCINGQSPLERYKSEDEERKKKVCRHSAASPHNLTAAAAPSPHNARTSGSITRAKSTHARAWSARRSMIYDQSFRF